MYRKYISNRFAVLTVIFLFTSCAHKYQLIRPSKLEYNELISASNNVVITFKQEILMQSGNTKSAGRELKGTVELLAVRIENNSDRSISFLDDVKIFSGEQRLLPIEQKVVHEQLKQRGGLYFFYSLLWLVFSTCNNGRCSTIPIPLGFLIGAGNFSKANNANRDFAVELGKYNLLNKSIPAGTVMYGLLGLPKTSGDLRFIIE